jgi:hypothetical protein
MKALRETRGIVLIYVFLTSALEGDEGSASHAGRTLTLGKAWYPFYRGDLG